MFGVNDGQLLARLGVERMLFQMFHVGGGELRRIGFLRTQMLRRLQQADVFDAFRHRHRLAVQRRQHHFFRSAQMGDALGGLQRQFRVGKPRADFLQGGARGIKILRQLDMPVGQLIHRGGKLLGRRIRLVAEMVQRDLRRGQILQILGLDAGQQHHAFKIVREFGELLANGHHRLEEFPPLSPGLRNGIIWLRLRRFIATVIQARQWPGKPFADMRRPHDRQD